MENKKNLQTQTPITDCGQGPIRFQTNKENNIIIAKLNKKKRKEEKEIENKLGLVIQFLLCSVVCMDYIYTYILDSVCFVLIGFPLCWCACTIAGSYLEC